MKYRPILPVFAATLFLSAFLLFSVQPMISKMLLPMLGGSPSVWNTAMVFFQTMLLLGYAYAHLSTKFLPFKLQVFLHVALAAIFLLTHPFAIANIAPPVDGQIVWQLKTMLVCIGGPFFVLAGSAPLFQTWFSHSGHKDAENPYFLYAVSNAGSIIALLLYPTLIEPALSLTQQKSTWLGGFDMLIVFAAICGLIIYNIPKKTAPVFQTVEAITWAQRLYWVFLAFIPSSLMLGLTTYVTTDLASVPMLWIIPLTLYLATFIFAFARRQIIPLNIVRQIVPFTMVLVVAAFAFAYLGMMPFWMILFHVLGFFMSALLCHGELNRIKPSVKYLTQFYLLMSLGGVLGGVLNALVAPLVFTLPLEYCLTLCCVPFIIYGHCRKNRTPMRGKEWIKPFAIGCAVIIAGITLSYFAIFTGEPKQKILCFLALSVILFAIIPRRAVFAILCAMTMLTFQPNLLKEHNDSLFALRNYFGVLKVTQNGYMRYFSHGTTMHGAEFLKDGEDTVPVTYYSPKGPAGDVFRNLDHKKGKQRVAALGLGVGSVACYTHKDRTFDFYEIDPDVVRIAQDYNLFRYLTLCNNYTTIMGDARMNLAKAANGSYDLIYVDTFSSDNIPVHMMTKEAFMIYRDKLAPGGVIAINISNRYLNLFKTVNAIGHELGMTVAYKNYEAVHVEGTASSLFASSNYVVLTKTPEDMKNFTVTNGWLQKEPDPNFRAWSDDYVNILSSMYMFEKND